eukprot:TRINITY_DN37675_c0_g1_i1.p1 TRINITY_DN37675_c0_g1~~TRINITY_DN37675_c0_g1_i1.p1  ORF type:complete len:942 (-),score=129.69 TRINITY_DN37675_c0_g1_i1:267-2930(-)
MVGTPPLQAFSRDTLVVFSGLRSEPELNGSLGIIEAFSEESGRWVVRVVDVRAAARGANGCELKRARPDNLVAIPTILEASAAPLPAEHLRPGSIVRFRGLQSCPEINGSVGVVQSWSKEAGRWIVLSVKDGNIGPDLKRVRPGNLELVPESVRCAGEGVVDIQDGTKTTPRAVLAKVGDAALPTRPAPPAPPLALPTPPKQDTPAIPLPVPPAPPPLKENSVRSLTSPQIPSPAASATGPPKASPVSARARPANNRLSGPGFVDAPSVAIASPIVGVAVAGPKSSPSLASAPLSVVAVETAVETKVSTSIGEGPSLMLPPLVLPALVSDVRPAKRERRRNSVVSRLKAQRHKRRKNALTPGTSRTAMTHALFAAACAAAGSPEAGPATPWWKAEGLPCRPTGPDDPVELEPPRKRAPKKSSGVNFRRSATFSDTGQRNGPASPLGCDASEESSGAPSPQLAPGLASNGAAAEAAEAEDEGPSILPRLSLPASAREDGAGTRSLRVPNPRFKRQHAVSDAASAASDAASAATSQRAMSPRRSRRGAKDNVRSTDGSPPRRTDEAWKAQTRRQGRPTAAMMTRNSSRSCANGGAGGNGTLSTTERQGLASPQAGDLVTNIPKRRPRPSPSSSGGRVRKDMDTKSKEVEDGEKLAMHAGKRPRKARNWNVPSILPPDAQVTSPLEDEPEAASTGTQTPRRARRLAREKRGVEMLESHPKLRTLQPGETRRTQALAADKDAAADEERGADKRRPRVERPPRTGRASVAAISRGPKRHARGTSQPGAQQPASVEDCTKAAPTPETPGPSASTTSAGSASAKAKTRKLSAKPPCVVEVPGDVASQARASGLGPVLTMLANRRDIASKGYSAAELLGALQQCGGLLHPAKGAP